MPDTQQQRSPTSPHDAGTQRSIGPRRLVLARTLVLVILAIAISGVTFFRATNRPEAQTGYLLGLVLLVTALVLFAAARHRR